VRKKNQFLDDQYISQHNEYKVKISGKKMKKKLSILLMLLAGIPVFSQKVMTLRECYEKAYAAAPLTVEKKTYKELWQLRD